MVGSTLLYPYCDRDSALTRGPGVKGVVFDTKSKKARNVCDHSESICLGSLLAWRGQGASK